MRNKKIPKINFLLTLVCFGLIGTVVVFTTSAQSLNTSLEVEEGLRQGNVYLFSEPGTSSSGALRFGGAEQLLSPDSRGFTPYAYVPWGDVSMSNIATSTGIKNFTAAFIQDGGGCIPAWDGNSTLGLNSVRANIIKTDINNIRSQGGDVTVSFGGAGGTELAVGCTSPDALKNAYRAVVDTYGLTRLDFDIEGQSIANDSVNLKRAQALLYLQQSNSNLKIFITLSVNPNGIPSAGINFLTQLRDNGVRLAGINIMTMDYGINSTQMGQVAIASANGTFSQIKSVYGNQYSDSTVWKSINLTAMIGVNDTQPETFTLQNAQELRAFADQKKAGALSFWSINRDKSCPNNANILSETCSGVTQSPYQFSTILNMPPN